MHWHRSQQMVLRPLSAKQSDYFPWLDRKACQNGETPFVPGDRAELIAHEGCVMTRFADGTLRPWPWCRPINSRTRSQSQRSPTHAECNSAASLPQRKDEQALAAALSASWRSHAATQGAPFFQFHLKHSLRTKQAAIRDLSFLCSRVGSPSTGCRKGEPVMLTTPPSEMRFMHNSSSASPCRGMPG